MDRVERGRFCHGCDKKVHDLSSMTEPEAKSVLNLHAGKRICVSYAQDSGGNIRFRKPAAVAAFALAVAACTPHSDASEYTTPSPPTVQVAHAAPTIPTVHPSPTDRRVKGEAPPEIFLGDVMAPEPTTEVVEPARTVKGDVAVPQQPCD